MNHSPDCAMVLYRDVPPHELKRPLECDCDAGLGVGDGAVSDDFVDEPAVVALPPRPKGQEVLTGDAAAAYRVFRAAASHLRTAQLAHAEALRQFTEAITK